MAEYREHIVAKHIGKLTKEYTLLLNALFISAVANNTIIIPIV